MQTVLSWHSNDDSKHLAALCRCVRVHMCTSFQSRHCNDAAQAIPVNGTMIFDGAPPRHTRYRALGRTHRRPLAPGPGCQGCSKSVWLNQLPQLACLPWPKPVQAQPNSATVLVPSRAKLVSYFLSKSDVFHRRDL